MSRPIRDGGDLVREMVSCRLLPKLITIATISDPAHAEKPAPLRISLLSSDTILTPMRLKLLGHGGSCWSPLVGSSTRLARQIACSKFLAAYFGMNFGITSSNAQWY
jgi:hypothetical protein